MLMPLALRPGNQKVGSLHRKPEPMSGETAGMMPLPVSLLPPLLLPLLLLLLLLDRMLRLGRFSRTVDHEAPQLPLWPRLGRNQTCEWAR